jgi:preprotein translocase subunit SecF
MPLKIVPDNTNIGFVKLRYLAFALTLLLTLGSIGLLATRGLNLGVDFVGGLTMEVAFPAPPPLDKLRGEVAGLGVGDVSLQEFGNARTILIRLPLPPGDQAAVQRVVGKVQADLKGKYGNVSFRRTESVSGKVSQELIRKGALAVLLSMAAVALFTWFRFEWHFGVSTVVALVHDVTVTLGFFALTQLEFDLNVVAAILTIIGYSLNDKVVIDDRIRENLRKYRQMDIGPIIDLSVNETLPRTAARPRCHLRLHRGDAARHRRRHLFVDLRLVVAADRARRQAEDRGGTEEDRPVDQRRARAAVGTRIAVAREPRRPARATR